MAERKKEKKSKLWLILFIIMLFLLIPASFVVCFMLYMNDGSDALLKLNNPFASHSKSVQANASENDIQKIVNPVVKTESKTAEYYQAALFIGNSELKGLSDYSLVPNDRVIAEKGLTSANISEFVVSYKGSGVSILTLIENIKPETLYLMFGSSELSAYANNGFFENERKFVETVKTKLPNTEIYLISLLPVTADNETAEITNAKIIAFNSELLNFANENSLYYLDINVELTGNDGKLNAAMAETSLTSRLNKDAYNQISDYILSHTAEK